MRPCKHSVAVAEAGVKIADSQNPRAGGFRRTRVVRRRSVAPVLPSKLRASPRPSAGWASGSVSAATHRAGRRHAIIARGSGRGVRWPRCGRRAGGRGAASSAMQARAPGERAHACWRRGSGSSSRPSTAGLRPTLGAISTTGRRTTTRPCNLSRLVTQPAPLRCALACRQTRPGRPRLRVHRRRDRGAM